MPRKRKAIAPAPQEANGQFCFASVKPGSLPPPSTTYKKCPECGETFSLSKCGVRDGRKCCIDCGQCKCGHCTKYGEKEDMEDIGGEWYCEDCHYHCEHCEQAHETDSDELVQAYGSYRRNAAEFHYCKSCTFECADCDKRFADSLEAYENPEGDRICERCRDNYHICESCSCVLCSDDAHEYNERYYCESCYDERRANDEDDDQDEHEDEDDRLIHDHSYKPRPLFLKREGQKTDEFYGLELEVDRHHASSGGARHDIQSAAIPSEFYCKHDGSLSRGFEVVSHPATYEWFADHKWEWTDKLRASGYRSYDTDTCGIHIHVSKRALSSLDILKLLEFFKFNPQFVHFISRRRMDRLQQWSKIHAGSRLGQISKIQGNDDDCDRYEAINLLNRHTIEFRIFKGTLARVSILRNIGFVRTLIRYVKQSAMPAMSDSKGYREWIQENAAKVLGKGEVAKSLVKWINGFEANGGWSDAEIRLHVYPAFADIAA